MTGKKAAAKPVQPSLSAGRRRRAGRGALWLIALLLASSGVIRLGTGSSMAIAREVAALAGKAQGDTERGAPAHDGEAACDPPPDLARVLEVLRNKEEQLGAREAALTDRMQALKLAEDRIRRNMAALVAAEEELKSTIALADGAAESDLQRLTAVYENMKPKQAAPLFAAMAPDFAAGFLGRMRPDAAAAIMAGLDPQAAYTISAILAGRNATVPTD